MARALAPGWRPVLLAAAAFLVLPSMPTALRSVVPITETWVLLAGALAVCAALGWWNGGRAAPAVAAAVFAGIALGAPLAGSTGGSLATVLGTAGASPVSGYAGLARGWTLLLAAAFGVVSLLSPAHGFFTRALSATGLAFAAALALTSATPAGPATARTVVQQESERRTAATLANFREMTSSRGWRDAAARSPQLDSMVVQNERELTRLPGWTARFFPALLGLESLAALAVAWAAYHRITTVPAGPRLGKLRDFRFNDQLVWGLATGGVLAVVPGFADARTAGLNLLLFFGALYLLRGVGVLSWAARGRWIGTLMIVLTIFAPYLLALLAVGVGVADTWMDWRSRPRRPA